MTAPRASAVELSCRYLCAAPCMAQPCPWIVIASYASLLYFRAGDRSFAGSSHRYTDPVAAVVAGAADLFRRCRVQQALGCGRT